MPSIRELNRPTLPPSLWAATAREAISSPPIVGDLETDVLVVGAGFTGLACAVHISESGRQAVVLDGAEPGWGASGRNGGQVIPGLKYEPDELERRYGPDLGPRLVATAGNAPDLVFQLIDRYGIDCDAVRRGWLQPAHSERALATVTERAAQWAHRGVAARVIDADETCRLIGCDSGYVGGWIDPRGGAVQPLSYARGLARAARSNGACIFGHSRVHKLQRDGAHWVAQTTGGRVRARKVVLATNGYSDHLWPKLAQSVVPAFSFQIATAPLPEAVVESIFPEGHVASDTRRLLWYYRLDAQGRLLMGGRGPFTDAPTLRDGSRLRATIEALFPQIGVPRLEYVWSGRVAMTQDHMPHLHVLGDNVYAGMGFNGRGVAMGTTMGRLLAELASGEAPESVDFPVTRLSPIRFHGLTRPAVHGLIHYYRFLDRREASRSS